MDPHAAYDRFMTRQSRWAAWWRRFGQIAFYVLGGVLAVTFAVLLVVGVIDLGQPKIWGTFTQTDCEPRPRGGCRPIGTWVSDDRDVVRHEVYLDGWAEGSGTVRASYQPTAILGGESADIVHTAMFTGAGPWITGAALLCWVGYVLYKAASWGDIPVPRSRRRGARGRSHARRTGSATGASLRREYRRSLDESIEP